jgi:hypothetical protein
MIRRLIGSVCVMALTATMAACNLSAPLRPTPPAVSGGSLTGDATLKVTAPSPRSPANGQPLEDVILTGITLAASESSLTHATSAALQYEFELMNAGGSVVERSGARSGPTWTQSARLDYNARYTWRVRAVQDGNAGPWSDAVSFLTRDLPAHFRCGPPFFFSALDIITCHRSEFVGLDHHEFPVLLKRIARDLNKAGVDGGPFGVLVKTEGNNCEGYSCDIICSHTAGDHDQYDVLLDENIPQWNEVDNPTVRPCEIMGSEQLEGDQ